MPTNPPTRKGPRSALDKDRRVTQGTQGMTEPLRRLKGALGRPLGLERRDGQLHVVLTERRREPPVDEKPSLLQLCDELSARMLAHGPDYAAKAMRHLVVLHDVLGHRGWQGVAALPGPVLRDESDSRLHDFRVGENLEVTESTFAEFDHLERSWAGTTPAKLVKREGDDD